MISKTLKVITLLLLVVAVLGGFDFKTAPQATSNEGSRNSVGIGIVQSASAELCPDGKPGCYTPPIPPPNP
jgi:hypothetical protein